ncbi:hypothetical protein ACWDRR_23295 [Kitasatospora sp. NPDC003701]
MSYRSKLRGVVVGACTAALVAGSGLLALPVQADSRAASAAALRAPQASRAEVQVNAFFSQYRSAVLGQNPNQNPREVRQEFLTPELDTALDTWAADNQADPVFRAQNVPANWSVAYGGSGAGHSTVILTEYWRDGSTTTVWYQVRLSDLRINDLKNAPA